MTWIWIAFAALVGLAGVRHRQRIRSMRAPGGTPRIDDDALHRILRDGTLTVPDEDEPIDADEAARAEDEFWSESWDEPEEYPR
jgi:hypothetical protein